MAQPLIFKYLRQKKGFPHVWCPGCGHGIVLGSIIRAIDKLGIAKDDIAIVSGIGCSSRIGVYVDFNTLHTLHGRAIAFATGVKLANPRLKVIVVTGDGDALAIGGNHFIHAARRNMDMTVILMNNNIYGMTGGQVSPTTPLAGRGSTAKHGNPEEPFDIAQLAIAAGASFVGVSTAYHINQMDKIMEEAIGRDGFSFVEAFSQCPTYEGKWNRRGDATEMMKLYKDIAVPIARAQKMEAEALQGKLKTGVLWRDERAGFVERYREIVNQFDPGTVREQKAAEKQTATAESGKNGK
jgi:2-oxoglutarate ferredoxin oxidoreductase subunit beta